MKCKRCGGLMRVALDNKETYAQSCYLCGAWVETPRIVLPMSATILAPSRPNNFAAPAMKPCPVVGCEKTMRVDSERAMCRKCVKLMYDWTKGAQSLRPPVMEVDGELWLRSYYDKTKGEKAA